jgi:hypothetical protein
MEISSKYRLGGAHARRVLGDLLGCALHLLAELGGARLGLRIEVGDASYLDELFLRLLEARAGIASKNSFASPAMHK